MVFSKHNFMIGVVIVHVFFYFNGILVSAKELSCLDALKEDKLDNIIMVKEKIYKFYAARQTLSNYGTNYVLYLISLVKRPERMLPPETWCEIEDCFISFSSPFSGTEYNNYIEEASEAISKYNKNLYACTINVCYENIITPVDIPITSKNDKKDNNIKDDSIRLKIGFLKLYLSNKKKFFRREPLTWCVIQACYTLLLQQGFDDVPAKKNRELVNKSTARKHTHAHRFFKFINSLESGKKPKPVNIDHTTAEPFDMNLLYEFPSNWCAVQVCYNDLKRVGFVFDTFEKNYEFLPKIKQTLEQSIGKRIVQITDYIVFVLFGQKIEKYISEYIMMDILWVGNLSINHEYIGTVIGDFFGKYIRKTAVSFMNSYIGEFIGMKIKEFLIKKCDNEEPGKYLQYLFDMEKILIMDEKTRFYQSEFVPKYCSHLEKLIFLTQMHEEDKDYYIPADRMRRNPWEWCMVTVVHSEDFKI